mmetsp:Transcript_22713/g.43606  ORF Transcript_22713/g.43606 Transcript_22713/m.43606 type:complete len:83 (+) Transcript_22713:923-1171(+)
MTIMRGKMHRSKRINVQKHLHEQAHNTHHLQQRKHFMVQHPLHTKPPTRRPQSWSNLKILKMKSDHVAAAKTITSDTSSKRT